MDALANIRAAVIVVGLYAIGALAYLWMPPVDTPAIIAFLLPTTAAGIYLLMRGVYRRDLVRSDNGAFAATYYAIVFRVLLFIAGLHCTIVLAMLGRGIFARTGPLVPRLTPILLGLFLMSVGNLLPRVKPNLAIGIRTTRTLQDRPAWLRVNRMAGYVAVALGAIVLAAGVLVPRGPLVAGTIGVAGMVAIVTLAGATVRLTHESSK